MTGPRLDPAGPVEARVVRAPAVSVVLPTYDHADFLAAAVRSILCQTLEDWELVIVDDGSTDATQDAVSGFVDPRIQSVRLPQNAGLPNALNVGFAQTRGAYLTWTSADNELLPNCLDVLAEALNEHPGVGLVYASHRITGSRSGTSIKEPFDLNVLRGGRNVVGPCFMYRREVMEAVGPYDLECFGAEDYDMWLRIADEFPVMSLRDILYVYRYHERTITAQKSKMIGAATRRALAKNRHRSPGRMGRSNTSRGV